MIGSAQARNVTREKLEQGPRRQVVIFGGSALRVLLSCHRKARRPLLPAAAACVGEHKEWRAGLTQGWGPALAACCRPSGSASSLAAAQEGSRKRPPAMSQRD